MTGPLPVPGQFLILCVEDEPRLRANIVEELMDAGYSVIQAGDGQSALDLLGEHQPDLVLCDITMPRMGGYELLNAVRVREPSLANVPFIFLTALSDRLAVIEGKTAGADDYLTKPIDFDLMLATIRSRLDQVVRIRTSLNSAAERQRMTEVAAALRSGMHDLTTTLEHVALGVLLFDGQKALTYHNRQAGTVLGKAISFANGRLSSHSPQQSIRLRQALAAAVDEAQNSDLLAIEQEEGHPLLVQFIALGGPGSGSGASAAMFLIDTDAAPPISEALAAKLFALTPTEARVASAIARGLRTDEIALDMGITSTTFAFHLRNIFRKAGVNRQQELVAILSRSAGLMTSNDE
jgi:DNA-binding NarL/FixJ family response regulator